MQANVRKKTEKVVGVDPWFVDFLSYLFQLSFSLCQRLASRGQKNK